MFLQFPLPLTSFPLRALYPLLFQFLFYPYPYLTVEHSSFFFLMISCLLSLAVQIGPQLQDGVSNVKSNFAFHEKVPCAFMIFQKLSGNALHLA
jgi:hypothetical protein